MSPLAPPESAVDDDTSLSQIVDGLVAAQAQTAALDAQTLFHLAAAMRIATIRMSGRPAPQREREMELRSIAAEIGTALRMSDRTVQSRMSDARQLTERFPATVEALAAGRITARHASAIRDAGCVIDDPGDRAAFETVVVDHARGSTPARTRDFAAQLAERLCPESVIARRVEAHERRRVTVREVEDGMAELIAYLPLERAYAIADRLRQQGRAVLAVARDGDPAAPVSPEPDVSAPAIGADAGARADAVGADTDAGGADAPAPVVDTRTLDQVRADVFCDLLLTGSPAMDHTRDRFPGGLGAIRARIQVTVPAVTLAGAGERGASIDGRGFVAADTARDLAADSPGYDRIAQHPTTGAVLSVDRYRWSERMRRHLQARDVHCRFPGCRQPARTCHIDHTVEWHEGGTTDTGNLACLCVRHHTLKTETPWTVTQRSDGTLDWVTPLGRHHPEPAPARVVFVPDEDPPPF